MPAPRLVGEVPVASVMYLPPGQFAAVQCDFVALSATAATGKWTGASHILTDFERITANGRLAMTPQEQDLITQLLERLKQTDVQGKDLQAEALIKAGIAAQPDAPYQLVQTALIQNMALEAAQARIAELEQQLAAAQRAGAKPTSFLGSRTGSVPASPAAQLAEAPPSPWG